MSETEQSVTLLPCPLFGHQPQVDWATRATGPGPYLGISGAPVAIKFYSIICPGCCSTASFESRERAITAWNSRVSVVAPQGDVLHWQLKAGVEETMCGVALEAEEGIKTTLLPDAVTCKACDAAAWGYKCGRADAAAPVTAPVSTGDKAWHCSRRPWPCRYPNARQCAHDTMLGDDCSKVCECECHAATPPPAVTSPGVEAIARERQRHFDVEGWTPEHDDEHVHGELAVAAACYAVEHTDASVRYPDDDPEGSGWPWGERWWKPKGELRNLARAGALIAAEIDRLERSAKSATGEALPAVTEAGEQEIR